MECMSIVRPGSAAPHAAGSAAVNGFYGPSQLRSGYKIAAAAARDGRGKTIAIVDAYSDPEAAPDLASYRSRYHLGACTTGSGCLRIVNEVGEANPLPRADWDWAGEESTDLDMVSAICPRCRIVLVEARTDQTADLGRAEDTAVAMGAGYVSNSWGGPESSGQDQYNSYFNHPGVVVDFAGGDSGYGAAYPADLQYVTSVGGTTLSHAGNRRGWTETVWGTNVPGEEGTGSGCSALEPKPSWQRADARSPGGCLNRTQNDVAAVADPQTGVAIYDTYPSPEWPAGWNEFGGTSVAAPIITAVYALAGTPAPRTYPAEYPYLHAARLFKVAAGSNGVCEQDRRYLCHGGPGYNGPAGLGTPDGTAAFTDNSARTVTVVDPGTQVRAAGTRLRLRVTGLDSARVRSLRWSLTLPGRLTGKLSVRPAGGTDSEITGTLPSQPGRFALTITAADGSATGSTHISIVTVPSLPAAHSPSGHLVLTSQNLCADYRSSTPGQPVRLAPCAKAPSQAWAYRAGAQPGDAGTLTAGGSCLSLTAGQAVLARCNGSAREQWKYPGLGELANLKTGKCLAVPDLRTGAPLKVATCNSGKYAKYQTWTTPAGPIESRTAALCIDGPDSGFGAQARVSTCDKSHQQQWVLHADGTIASPSGLCLDSSGTTIYSVGSILDGTPVILNFCSPQDPNQVWLPGPGGELINYPSGKCLADDPARPERNRLVDNDCYNKADEIWALN
jgi:hypothetical protein